MLTHLTPLHLRTLAQVDPDIAKAIADETHRQNTGLELIASENFASAAVMAAAGSVMTNKYAEGYPGKRYYGGCEFVDVAEQLAIDRAKALFGAEHANVQPHSGAQANMSVFISLLDPGDTILGMNLAHGGHLTHGHPLNFSGKFYKVVPYGVREDDERLDYDELERLAHEHKPKLIIVGASAYSRIIDFERIATVAQATGARMFTDMAHIAGLVAGGVHPSPVPHSDYVTTTTHKTLRGPRGGLILTREANAKAIDRALFPGVQGGPLMHVIAAKAVCFREAMEMPFRAYQAQVATNARRLAQSLRDEGFRLVSGGTDNHLMLVDVFSKGITGKQAEKALGEAGITVNKNAIPFDKNPPMVASGIRVGTPAVTTRGMGEAEMDRIADLISAALREPENSTALGKVRAEVEDLCREFPLYPPPSLIDGVRRVLGTGGALAAVLDGFEPRASQQEMAEAVARVVTTGGVLLAEAGTGTGKTLAYLVPAILSGRKTLVSTGTRNLQQQLIDKDVPLLQRALGPFRATCMKGRNNYLCLHRFEQARLDERPRDDDTRVAIALIEHWAPRTQTGDRAEIADLPEDLPFWHTIAATTENCLGSECPRYSDCFVTRMRQEAADADVVIVNHHLLCADAALRRHSFGEVIPECQVGIIDEAHQLEDVATQYFGLSVSNFRIEQLFTDAAAVRTSPLFVPHEDAAAIARAIEALAVTARAFFLDLQTRRPGVRQAADGSATLFDERLRVNGEMLADAAGESGLQLIEALSTLEEALALLKDAPEDLRAIAKRAGEIRDDLKFLLRAEAEDYVYFLELRGRHVALRAAPIDVSHIIRDVLIDRLPALVLTSATLSIGGSFGYVRARLGVGESLEVKVPSEFDYRTQALVYLPRKMPDPRTREYAAALADEAAALLTASEGRAFLLFTSYAALRDAHARLSTRLPYPMLVQGTMPRGVLIEQFRKTPNAVLFGTASFWQGVDVVGEALSCVIIDRIPFASPGDPVVAARIEALQRRGIDAFAGFQVPLAILTLLQGVGRLIRHRQDRGVIALLDPRLQSMGYGRRFLNALPPAPVTRRPEDVTKFFAVRG